MAESAHPTEIAQCTPMRAAGTLTRPAFTMPAGACDTHFHVFEPGYPHVAAPLYTFPDGTADQYLAMAEFLGLERMVLVQPTYYGTDNSLLRDVLKRLGRRCGGVIRIEEFPARRLGTGRGRPARHPRGRPGSPVLLLTICHPGIGRASGLQAGDH